MTFLHQKKGTRKKLFLFLLAGFPAFLIALPLNYTFVEILNLNKALAYMIVLIVQVSINFFACCLFVFQRDVSKSLPIQFAQFVSGIFFARFFDWVVYSILVHSFGVYFLFVQVANVIVFSLLKFNFAQRVMEGKKTIF